MKVLGVVPPTGKYIREDRCQTPIKKLKTVALRPPIDLMYALAGFEAAGCACRLIDYPGEEQGWEALRRDVEAFAPHTLLISVTTPTLKEDLRAAALAKTVNPSILTVAKGAHFNTLDVATLERFPDLDLVLRGEYEETCMELGAGRPPAEVAGLAWRAPDGRIVRNPDRPLPADLDRLPFPARGLANNALYCRPDTGELQTTIVTNRGCPFHCIYCLANQVSGVRNRYRSVENVLGEIKECVERFGIRNFLFRSDLFTQNKKWVIRLCQAILDARLRIAWACNSRVDTITPEAAQWMKRAGCWIVAFGVESGDQAMLDRMDKAAKVETSFEAIEVCRRAGLRSSVYLLIGLPWDSPETIEAQMAYARRLDPDILEYFYVYPFPGTPLYDACVEQGLLQPGEVPREAYDGPAMPSLHLSVEELKSWRRRALRDFYLRPSKILRTLAAARTPRQMTNYLRAGWGQLVDLAAGS